MTAKAFLPCESGPGRERGPDRAERFGAGAERLKADHQFAREARFVAAEAQDRIVVPLRQRQEEAVAPDKPERDRRLAERQPLAALEAADGLHLRVAQIAGRQDLLLDRIDARVDGDHVGVQRAVRVQGHQAHALDGGPHRDARSIWNG